jgi:hypothetical protein
MAYTAILTRVEFLGNKRFMNILVAILAIDPYLPEAPFLLFSVAIDTWYSLMRTIQYENSFVVLFNCKGKHCKSFYIMTLSTIGSGSILSKLPVMIIVVTIQTTIMLYRIGKLCRFMAFIAVDSKMLILKPECGLTMVEATRLLYV